MKSLLWIGDAGCPSGFARATHNILDTVHRHFDVTVLGMNYRGDPHEYPYPIYAAFAGGDPFGVGRLIWMCDLVKPDVIVLQNDPWNVQMYTKQLRRFKEYANVPVVGAIAVDGKNCMGDALNDLAHVVFWTRFGLEEARKGGLTRPSSVIPLGVDRALYYPSDRGLARTALGIGQFENAFIVGNVNRNQPRKRLDLTVRYFAEWVRNASVEDAWLYLHVAPTGDAGVDVKKLAKYYGVLDRLMLHEPPTWYGVTEDAMRDAYNAMNVYISTTQGEGMGLPAMEAMACGVPCLLPRWSAYGDWAIDAARLVECTSTAIGPPYVNVIGGVPDEAEFIQALDDLYSDVAGAEALGQAGLARVSEDRFRWSEIGERWTELLTQITADHAPSEDEWRDLGRPEELGVVR